jgi:hypothetical protein
MSRIVSLLLCTFFGGALVGTGAAKQAAGAAYPLSQPEQWVPFSADVLHISATGRASSGRFYRGEDGSTRHDIVLDYGHKVVPEIRIENFADRRFYYNDGRDEWLTGPLDWGEQAFSPQPWSSRAIGLTTYRHKVALLRGHDGSLRSEAGLDAMQFSDNGGTTKLLVPALNFFAVVNSRLDGQRRVYSNIDLSAIPDTELFRPPTGATLQEGAIRPSRAAAAHVAGPANGQ